MFNVTFYNSVSSGNINDIFDGANIAGVTAANAGGASGVFYQTFYDGLGLTGSAQDFIDEMLGGIVPDNDAQTFFGQTGLSDYNTINANWK
jgi:hypothetical protein